jgi:2-polyprenyl-6-methoxyphenol hydroxylase-like FAD-dependent oxidoreductase
MAYFWSSTFVPALLPQSIMDKLPTAEVNYGLTTPQGAVHEYVAARNTATGEILKKIPTPGGRRVSRRRFRQVLGEGLDIQHGKNVIDVSYPASGVVVHFEDGTATSGSLVIGADGGASRIRRLILGDKAEPTVLPIVMNNFNTQYTAEQALSIREGLCPFTDYGVHPKGFFFLMAIQNVPDPADPSTWYFQLLTSWSTSLHSLSPEEDTSENRLRALKELTADFSEPRRSAMAWVPEGTYVPKDRLAIWSPVPWDHHGGRVTLAGDAAHAMTNHRGQGLNNCLNDAYNLVMGLVAASKGEKSMESALTEYGAEVVVRGAAEVEMSRLTSMGVHNWDKFMESPVMKHGLARLPAEAVKAPKVDVVETPAAAPG